MPGITAGIRMVTKSHGVIPQTRRSDMSIAASFFVVISFGIPNYFFLRFYLGFNVDLLGSFNKKAHGQN